MGARITVLCRITTPKGTDFLNFRSYLRTMPSRGEIRFFAQRRISIVRNTKGECQRKSEKVVGGFKGRPFPTAQNQILKRI